MLSVARLPRWSLRAALIPYHQRVSRRGLMVGCALLLAGCPRSEIDLAVELRTDLRGGTEFVGVRTELFDALPDDSATPRMFGESAATGANDYLEGERVADFFAPIGRYSVRVRLLDSAGGTVAERTAIVVLDRRRTVVIPIARACRAVTCPVGQTCEDGECREVECDAMSCPSTCESDSDCAPPSSCATPHCVEGTCLFAREPGACLSTEVCDLERGCVDVGDAGVDSGPDAGCGCGGRACGSDGCGGDCGTCGAGQVCDASGQCCTPQCAGRNCGPDGCGGECGPCGAPSVCLGTGVCCTPDCFGRNCGPDGCGGECGPACTLPDTCQGGVCRCHLNGEGCGTGTCCGGMGLTCITGQCCTVLGNRCEDASECCNGHRCAAPAKVCCVGIGQPCGDETQCCNALERRCRVPVGGSGPVCCVRNGDSCSDDAQCCSNDCAGGSCRAA